MNNNGKGKENHRNRPAYMASGLFYLLPRPFMWGLDPIEAIILASILDKEERILGARGRVIHGWFYYTIEDLFVDTGVIERTQLRAVGRLVSKGYLFTKRLGLPARRFLKVNHPQLEKDAREWASKREEAVRTFKKKKARRIKERIIDEESQRR